MFVLDALGIAGGSAGVAETEGGVLVEVRPLVPVGFADDELLVVHRRRNAGGPVLEALLHRDHDAFHGREAALERLEDRQCVGVGNDQSVLGMADDVDEILRRQA